RSSPCPAVFWRPVFLAQAPETARANINLDTLRPLRVPVPPLSYNKSSRPWWNERLRAVQREALRQARHLFDTLLHRAFPVDTAYNSTVPVLSSTSAARLGAVNTPPKPTPQRTTMIAP